MPTPSQGESQEDFVKRCIPIVIEDGTAKDGKQAAAICKSMWQQAQNKQFALSHNSTVADREPSWDAVDKTKLPFKAFAAGDPELVSSWSFPHHWVQNGGAPDDNGRVTTGDMFLHRQGLNSAWAAAQGARSGDKADPAIIAHLNDHRRALEMSTQNHGEKNELDIEVMSIGTWNNTKFTLKDLQEIAANFMKLKDLIKPPVKLGHTNRKPGEPAYGWVETLQVVGNKLIAHVIDIPKLLMEAIKAKRYRRVSSEIYFGFKHKGKNYGRVFSGLALLGADIPAVKDLKDLEAYLYQNADTDFYQNINAIGTFDEIHIFPGPVDFDGNVIDDDFNQNSDSKKEAIMADELEKKLKEFSDKLEALAQENSQLKITKENFEKEKVKFEQTVQENQTLKTEKEKLEKEKAEREKALFEEKKSKGSVMLKEFCEAQVKDGRMLPAQRDLLVGKEVFSDDGGIVITVDQFKQYVELASKVLDKTQHASDDQNNSGSFEDVQKEVDFKVQQVIGKNTKLTYAEALNHVLSIDPDLAQRYTSDIG